MVVAIDDPRRVVTTGMKHLDTDAECAYDECFERSWGWLELSEREQATRCLAGRPSATEEPYCLDHSVEQFVMNLKELAAVAEVLAE